MEPDVQRDQSPLRGSPSPQVAPSPIPLIREDQRQFLIHEAFQKGKCLDVLDSFLWLCIKLIMGMTNIGSFQNR